MGLRANPGYRHRRFGAEVKKLRLRAGLSSGEAAALMAMKQSQLSGIESGRTGLSADRLRRLADAAGLKDQPFVDALIDLGNATGKGWWSEYRDRLRPAFLDFAELEASAETLLTYEPTFIPGLLQTPEYALASYRGGHAKVTREEAELGVEFKVQRQRILLGSDGPRLHAIIHEAALHMSFGVGRELMRGQLLHLIEASRSPRVTVQVLPFAGPVPFGSAFTLAAPRVRELSTVYVPHIEESLYLADAEALDRYHRLFGSLRMSALPPVDADVRPEAHTLKDSLGLIQALLYPLL
ncbi:helix-turn-helix transcriptional regulator [Streptomyces sp. JH002]|uniref:helix-turn-helix domain-containing protein n=1 Tax=Streptomyces sp. JH002 TaxID=2763259 RepID=UPI003D8038D4